MVHVYLCSLQLLHNQLRLRHPSKPEADSCPTHPEPMPLPSSLPEDIANAISTLELYLTKAVDKTAVVSTERKLYHTLCPIVPFQFDWLYNRFLACVQLVGQHGFN